jgi:hypothetical protein
MTAPFTESVVEQAAFAWLESTGWAVRNGAGIAPGEPVDRRSLPAFSHALGNITFRVGRSRLYSRLPQLRAHACADPGPHGNR